MECLGGALTLASGHDRTQQPFRAAHCPHLGGSGICGQVLGKVRAVAFVGRLEEQWHDHIRAIHLTPMELFIAIIKPSGLF